MGELSQDSVARAAAAAAIAVPPVFARETTSTNEDAIALAERDAPEWTLVVADHQTAGRGRLGRSWASAAGKALLLSVVLRPPLPPDRAAVVSLLAAAKMADACYATSRGVVRTKWPNDIVVGERKLGGVLPEAKVAGRILRHLVIGIGVNVAMTEDDLPSEPSYPATSLLLEGTETDREQLLTRFLVAFRAAYRPIDHDFAVHAVAAYSGTCSTLGRRVRATTVGGEVVEGIATRLTGTGGLVVRTDGGERVVAFGEVEHLRSRD